MYPNEYMCTMSDTVEMTTSIITDIGSSIMPMSMASVSLMGSHVVFHGVMVGYRPSAPRPVVKK